jgi:FKBP-type peptidyl-prolyl cis-trans isomerase FkpA
MRFGLKCAMALAPLTVVGCQASVETDDQMMSYAIGREVGASLTTTGEHLDLAALIRGIEDALAELDPAVSGEDLSAARLRVGQMIQEEQRAEGEAASERNLVEGEAYLAANATKEGVTTTDSGLQYEALREGDGARPAGADRVSIHYRGTLIDGTEFDSSYERGEPAVFGVGGVIGGFSEGLQLMTVGSHYRLVIPSDIGYGAQGAGGVIGPNATLVFEIELLEIL